MQHFKWKQKGRLFSHADEGRPEQFTYKSSIGQHNVDLGDGTFAPYVWDSQNRILKFGRCELRFTQTGLEFHGHDKKLNTLTIHPEIKTGNWNRKTPTVSGLSAEEVDDGRAKVRLKISYNIDTDDMQSTVNILAGGNQKVHFSLTQIAKKAGEQRVNVQFEEKAEPVARKNPFTKEELTPIKYHFGESWYGWKAEEESVHAVDQKVDRTEFHLDRKVYVKDEVRTIHPDTWGTDVGIVANADDGNEFGGTWYPNGASGDTSIFGGGANHCGFRWGSITLSGTVDSCIIDVYSGNSSGTGGTGDFQAWDTANAGIFENGVNEPSGVTRTTASVACAAILQAGWYARSGLQSIVQEIVDSYGLSNEAINFTLISTATSGNYCYIEDYNNAGANEPELTITYTPAPSEIEGTTAWGHVTGVEETNTRTFAGNWTGTGTITGTGDTERIELQAGQYMESEIVNITGDIDLFQNEYDPTGDDVTLSYKTSATTTMPGSWTTYTESFTSLGYVQVRVEVT